MATSILLTVSSLIEQVEFIEGANIIDHGQESDEDRDMRTVILPVFAIWVEAQDPIVPSNVEPLACNVFPNTHSLCQRVTLYLKRVRPEHCLLHRFRTAARPHTFPSSFCQPANHHVGEWITLQENVLALCSCFSSCSSPLQINIRLKTLKVRGN